MFPNGVQGFLLSFQLVVFSFVGMELVGVSAAETANPRKNIPSAINKIPVRILLFYVGAIIVILTINPWTLLSGDSSPFVGVFTLIGIPIAAGIINFVVMTSAASACNSGLFSTSRILHSLSKDGSAPKRVGRLNKRAVPSNALLLSAIVVSVGARLSKVIPEQAFTIVTTISAICFIWVWSTILIAHIKYKKTRPELAAKSTFKAPFAPYINYAVLALFALVLIVMLFAEATRLALLLTPIWFIALVLLYNRSKNKNRILENKF